MRVNDKASTIVSILHLLRQKLDNFVNVQVYKYTNTMAFIVLTLSVEMDIIKLLAKSFDAINNFIAQTKCVILRSRFQSVRGRSYRKI